RKRCAGGKEKGGKRQRRKDVVFHGRQVCPARPFLQAPVLVKREETRWKRASGSSVSGAAIARASSLGDLRPVAAALRAPAGRRRRRQTSARQGSRLSSPQATSHCRKRH